MAKLLSSRTAQKVVQGQFTFKYDDTMKNVSGVTKDFGLTSIGAGGINVDCIELPPGAVVVGGSVERITAFDTAGYTITVGDADVADRYLAATDVKAAGRTALVPTGYRTTGKPIRVAVNNVDVCTAGECVVRVQYVIDGRAEEVA